MSINLSRAEEPLKGWILVTDENLKQVCNHCNKPVLGKFFYCSEKQLLFCRDCKLRVKGHICDSREEEHEHFNVLGIRRV